MLGGISWFDTQRPLSGGVSVCQEKSKGKKKLIIQPIRS